MWEGDVRAPPSQQILHVSGVFSSAPTMELVGQTTLQFLTRFLWARSKIPEPIGAGPARSKNWRLRNTVFKFITFLLLNKQTRYNYGTYLVFTCFQVTCNNVKDRTEKPS